MVVKWDNGDSGVIMPWQINSYEVCNLIYTVIYVQMHAMRVIITCTHVDVLDNILHITKIIY